MKIFGKQISIRDYVCSPIGGNYCHNTKVKLYVCAAKNSFDLNKFREVLTGLLHRGVKMEIITKPDYTTWQKRANCYQCGSVICGDYSDVKYECIERSYSDERDCGFSKYNEDHYYFICPVCHYKITIQGALPYLLKKFVLDGGNK